MIRLICFIVFWCTTQLFAQGNVPVECHGKVNADMTNLEGIYVINLKTENASITDREGYFSIKAAVGDTLLLSAYQFKSVKIALTPEHLQTNVFFVEMKPIMNELKEVVVSRYPNISAEGDYPKRNKKIHPSRAQISNSFFGIWARPLIKPNVGQNKYAKKRIGSRKERDFFGPT